MLPNAGPISVLDDLLNWPVLAGLGMDVLSTVTKAHVYKDGDEALIVDTDDVVSNVVRITATGKIDVKQNMVLTGQKIKSCASRDHCFALTECGVLYGWGCNSRGELGNTEVNEIPSESPIVVKAMEGHKVADVVCGSNHTLVLTEDGKVWTWGWKQYSQCTGTAQSSFTSPKSLDLPKCTCIAVSEHTSAVLTTDGSLYTWGYNGYGQIGNQTTNHATTPYKVKILRPLVRLAMGDHHILTLTDDGRLLSWGWNNNGQVGNNKEISTSISSPILIECREKDKTVKFFDIGVLGNTSAALSTDGFVYVWGYCGIKDHEYDQSVPLKTDLRNLSEALTRHSGRGTYRTLTIQNDDMGRSGLQAFDSELVSDCRFVVEGRTIHAQKAVLKNRSQYFQAMFNAEWKEANGEIKINNHTYVIYRALLKYLYSGKLEVLSDEELLSLLQLVHETMHEKLVTVCAEKLSYKISAENVVEMCDVARKLDAEPLLSCCRQYGQMFMKEIVKADKEHSELLTKFLVFVLTDAEESECAAGLTVV